MLAKLSAMTSGEVENFLRSVELELDTLMTNEIGFSLFGRLIERLTSELRIDVWISVIH
jgi:hypothetical protein